MEIGSNSSDICEYPELTATSSTGLNDNTSVPTKHKQHPKAEAKSDTTNMVKNFLYESGSQAAL